MNSSTQDIAFGMYPSSTRLIKVLQALYPPPSQFFCIFYWYLLHKSFIFMVFMTSSRQDVVFRMYPCSSRLVKFLQALFLPPSWLFWILYWFPFFYFHGSYEQLDIRHTIIKCVLCFQYLHQPRSDCFYSLKKKCNKIISQIMAPNFIASIIISVPTYNSMLHASFISMPQYEFNATK